MRPFVEVVKGALARVINSCPKLGHILEKEMRKDMDNLGSRKGGVIAKKDARTKGTRPTVPPGGIKPAPLNAGTAIGRRLSKLARR